MKNFHIKWLGLVFLWLFVVGEIIAQNATVTRVEYFIDNDPGVGNGTEVTITPGVTVAQTFQVPLSSLSLTDGIHRLSVRVKDSNNQWSWVANALFVKERITNTAAPIDITKIEYFFNLDPGSGNGIDVPITPATSLTNFGFTAPMPSLPIGFNYLSVRVKDARNGWTRSITRPFLKEELASNKVLPNITQIEYFLDEDPGPGNGSPLTFTAGTTVNNLSFTIPMPTTLSAGIHTFSVRAKDANNKWSIITTRAFIKENIESAIPLPAISRLEYFFDNDPGVGNGTSINFTAGTAVNDLSFDVPLPNALSSGLHKLTVRARDNKGKWSTTVIRTIYKENAAVTALPNVNRVEYFIDTDPGVGNGTNIPITANTTLTNINFTAPLTGLQNGKHFMEIRARDANNKWSTVAVREFVVCTNPFTAAISPATEQNTCDGVPVTLSVPTGYSYQWRLNGADLYNQSSNTLSATQSGDYTVVIAQNGCLFTTNPVRLNNNAMPSPPTITTLDQTICSGQKVTLESSNCGGLVTWSNGSTGGAIVVAPTITTTYTATCKVGICTSASSSTSSVITVNAALAAPTIAGPASAVCPSSNVTLTANGCAGTVTWNSGQTGSTLSFVATTAGTYSAICSSGVCTSVSSSTFSVSLINSTAKNMVLTTSNAKICSGQSTTLTATGCSGSIAWSTGSTTSTITVSPTTTGTYSATCTHNGCSSVSANTLKIDVSPIPSAPVVYGQSQTICKGTSVSLSAYFCIGGVINWSNGFVGQMQTVKPETTTVYRATCTKDGCASANSNAVTITVSECQNPAVNITKIEYFIDNDPGNDNGTNVPITSASVLNNFSFSIPIQASFADGYHLLSVRVKDGNNKWSWTAIKPFWKEALPSIPASTNVVKLEYFIDNDPGTDNGSNIPITAGTTINNLAVTIPLDNTLVKGVHILTLRAKNADGGWSTALVRSFYKDDLPQINNLANIVRLEYFIDTDPGYDFGTEIPITTNSTISNIPLIVNMSGLSQGEHYLEIRSKDANGKWSTVGVKQFSNGTNKITIGSVNAELCGQSTFLLPYMLEGTFNTGNTLIVQLLDANNNVVNGNLFSQVATANGTLAVPLPNVGVNTVYKFRIVSSDPAIMSDPVQFTLKPTTIPSIAASGQTTFCSGGSVLLTSSNCNGTIVWSNGITNNMISVTTSGTYSATCNMPNACIFVSSNSIVVDVLGGGASAPTVSGNTSLCGINQTTELTPNGCSGGYFSWYLVPTGGASQQNSSGPYTTPPLGSTSTFYVSCVIGGCESTRTPVTVTVNPIPTASITGSANLTCTTTTVTRTASGGSSYLWSNSLGTNAVANITTAGTYSVTVTAAGGCTATATTAVTSNTTPPTASISGVANLTCTVTSVTRTASGGGTYLWSNNLGTNAIANITNAGTYTVTVTNTTNGCTATATTTVTSNTTPPTISISGVANLTCAVTSVTRTASGGGTYLWSNSLGTNAIANITNAGTYTVTVTNTTNGCTATATTTVTSNTTPPTISISGVANLTCAVTSVTRTASGGGTYLWSNNLGTNAIANITNAGTYTVTVTNTTNGCTATATTTVTSNTTPPTASIAGTANLNCITSNVQRTASGGGTYLWSNSLGTNAIANITNVGTYTVTVTNTTNGCTATATTTVTSNTTPPTASIAGTANLNCITSNVQRTASGGGTYLWSNSLGTNAVANITSAGIYSVTVTASNGCTATATTVVTSNTTPPTASITGTTNLTCAATTVTRTASGGGTYLWSNSLGTNAIANITSAGTYSVTVTASNGCTATATTVVTSNTVAPTASIVGTTNLNCAITTVTRTASGGGTYLWSNSLGTNAIANITIAGTYKVTVTAANGCTATATTSVISEPTPPQPTISPNNPSSICAGQSVSLTANGCTGLVSWSNGMTGSAIVVTPTITTAYTAKCTINSCAGSNSTPVTVTLTTTCNYPITIVPSRVLVCSNTPVTLTASGCPNTISWTGGATGSSVTITPAVTGTYTATCAAGGSGNIVVTVGATTASLTIADNVMTGTAKFQLTQSIISESKIGATAINPKPNVLYQAGNSILLQPGFSIESGSVFNAKIQGCN